MADHSDDLDQLLDSALDDFHNVNLASAPRNGESEPESSSLSRDVRGLGMGLPDLRSKKKGKQKVAKESHASEALEKIRVQTRDVVKGIEAVTGPTTVGEGLGLGNDAMMEDWVKQFEELAGSQNMDSFVETMMQQLLSKEILHEPMKEIGERYPKWLENHKTTLAKEEYDRYHRQFVLIKDVNKAYETEPNNFNKIVDLIQKMQECGQPPNDIVQELTPDFDISTLGQLTPEMLESQQKCCIM